MSEPINPGQFEENETPESGLFLSAEPLEGSSPLSAKSDDSSADADSSDTSGDSGADTGGSGGADASDDASDSDASDSESDADGTDLEDADGTDTGADADGADPLGIASDGKDASGESNESASSEPLIANGRA
ncbi:MAG: hypothetical protein LC754_18895 [Acidobacteria bacterium]|nr:hypothetical protein [Acidobacteriota bacterium]